MLVDKVSGNYCFVCELLSGRMYVFVELEHTVCSGIVLAGQGLREEVLTMASGKQTETKTIDDGNISQILLPLVGSLRSVLPMNGNCKLPKTHHRGGSNMRKIEDEVPRNRHYAKRLATQYQSPVFTSAQFVNNVMETNHTLLGEI